MYRVTDTLPRFALALLMGATLATLWANAAPASYYDLLEWRLLALPLPGFLGPGEARANALTLVSDVLMAPFVFVIGKELWEAHMLERGALRGLRAGLPLLASVGAMAGGVAVWISGAALTGATTADGLFTGWPMPVGGDLVIAYIVGRAVFGAGHPGMHLLLLVTIGCDLAGLLALAVASPADPVRLVWLGVPALAALAAWICCGRHAHAGRESLRQRAGHLWPYLLAGLASWAGMVAAGLPGALGLLPVIPAIPHAERSFGVFAHAERVLHDPLNRIARLALPVLPLALFLFGLTRGAMVPAALGPATLATLAAFCLGKPLGLMAGASIARRVLRLPLPAGLGAGDLWRIALISGLGFTVPLIAIDSALPGGAMAEAARLGLAPALLAAAIALPFTRR